MRGALAIIALLALSGCVTSTVDEILYEQPGVDLGDSSLVILGRRHASDHETEPDFIECVGDHVASSDQGINVVQEDIFVDAMYPWFEPRTAPLRPEDIDRLLESRRVRQKLEQLKTGYMVWIDGKMERTDGTGSMTCGIGPAFIPGCFGFGTWSNEAHYEAVIWDFADRREVGRMTAKAEGQSYVPAVIVPIPIIAPVRGTVCDSLGDQLLKFFSAGD